MRRVISYLVGGAGIVLVLPQASGLWQATLAEDSTGRASALRLEAVNAPTATVSEASSSVTITWSTPEEGLTPTAYEVRVVDHTGTARSATAGCSGPVSGTACIEDAPDGTWRYAVTPHYLSWSGPTSAYSAAVTVGSGS